METEGPLNVPYYSWRESSAIITPTQAFLYVDELSHWYYEAHKSYIHQDGNVWVIIDGKHVPIPYQVEDYALILDPIIPDKVLAKHGKWLEACNVQGKGKTNPEPETEAVKPDTSIETLAKAKSEIARYAANVRHDKPGGSRDKQRQIREIWASGKYKSRDICAEQECAGLGMSIKSARNALINQPDP